MMAQMAQKNEVQNASAREIHMMTAADGNDIFHVAIFRFPKEPVNDAMALHHTVTARAFDVG